MTEPQRALELAARVGATVLEMETPVAELADALEKTAADAASVARRIAAIENYARRVDRRLRGVRALLEQQECDPRLWGRGVIESPAEQWLREQLQRLHLALEKL